MKMIKNVDIDQMYAEETTRPKTKIEKLIEEKQARLRIREKSLDIIEACALATTPETLENDAWQLAHTARTWMEIYTNLNAVDAMERVEL
jgi:hemoglobin-like flavoprotein